MVELYKFAYEGSSSEIVEKKSRFIATVYPVENQEQALEYIEEAKKKNWNATHNCYAYVCGEKHELQRFSDDGEPSGTAGKPILDVLLGEDVHDTLIIVTRYFGGTLLGTGGLVRAYSKVAKEGLLASTIVNKQYGSKMRLVVDYNNIGKVQYLLASNKIEVLTTDYTDNVEITVIVPVDQVDNFETTLVEATSANISIEHITDCYYANINGTIQLF